ncbi:MAG: hypothetical protein H7Z10_07910 [Gemmatimonadaceae bacterium]|nr:hypothetical protein [Acetobacteraceae bacterium]
MRWIVLAALLSGCAPGFDRPAFLTTFVGQPEAEVVRRLGVPSRTYETGSKEAGGRTFLAYSDRRIDIVPGGPFFGGFGYFGGGYGRYGGGFPSQVIERGCETTFEVADGRVLSWSLRGNAC